MVNPSVTPLHHLMSMGSSAWRSASSADPAMGSESDFRSGRHGPPLPDTDLPQAAGSNFSSNIPLEPSGTGYVESLVRLQAQAAADDLLHDLGGAAEDWKNSEHPLSRLLITTAKVLASASRMLKSSGIACGMAAGVRWPAWLLAAGVPYRWLTGPPSGCGPATLRGMDEELAELAAYFRRCREPPAAELVRLAAAAQAAGSRWEAIAAACAARDDPDPAAVVYRPFGLIPGQGAGPLFRVTQHAVYELTGSDGGYYVPLTCPARAGGGTSPTGPPTAGPSMSSTATRRAAPGWPATSGGGTGCPARSRIRRTRSARCSGTGSFHAVMPSRLWPELGVRGDNASLGFLLAAVAWGWYE